MNEEFLHFIFRFRLWDDKSCILNDGRVFEIIDVGTYNLDSGPDFFNAKVKIDNTVWVGNVEIHVNSSDWYKHSHHNDASYNNVILHVVYNNNMQIFVEDREIPTWEIKFSHLMFNKYAEFKLAEGEIPCAEYISMVDEFKSRIWLDKMAIERIEDRLNSFEDILEITKGDFESILYLSLARSFGFGINADAFYSLGLTVPLSVARHYFDRIFSLEALFLGQSGFLEEAQTDDYVIKLRKEYDFLRKKHQLYPMNHAMWKKSKIMPAGNPELRIAQFVMILTIFDELISIITSDSVSYKSLRKLFRKSPSQYWDNHYYLAKPVERENSTLGKTAFDLVYLNTIIPVLFFWHKKYNPKEDFEIIFEELRNLKPENNRIIRSWKSLGIIAENAYESQALINLKKKYCDEKKCLRCNIGYEILNKIYSIDKS